MGIPEALVPIVTVLAFVAYLAPGLLLLLLLPRPPERASTWLALAAPLAVAIQIVMESALKLITLPVPERNLTTIGLGIVLLIAVLGLRRRFPVRGWPDVRVLICAAVVPMVFATVFHEAIWTRPLTSDGIEAVGMAQELATHFLPRWPSESGLKGFGQGLIAFAFPTAWFGSNPRMSFLLFLGVVTAGVLALVETRRQGRLGWMPAAAVAVSVLAAGVTLGLQVSFEPYFADPGNPAGPEIMVVAMMLAAFVAMIELNLPVYLIAAVLAHATLPSGLLFVIVLGLAWFAMTRSLRVLAWTGAAIALCVLVTLLYEKVYVPHALPPGLSMDAGSDSILGRMRLLIFTDFARLAFLFIPCGFVPAGFLFFWKKQDSIACFATLVTGAMFLFFFVLATYSPHYFAPAMFLVLVPYWRWARGRAEWIGLAGAVVGLALSLPPFHAVAEPFAKTPEVIRVHVDLDQLNTERRYRPRLQDFLAPADLLQRLAYLPWEDVDPTKSLVASGLQLARNSRFFPVNENAEALWVVLPDANAPPPGYRPVASQGGWSLFARADTRIEEFRDHGYPTDFQSPWFRVPREALFRVWTERSGRYDLDLRSVFGRAK